MKTVRDVLVDADPLREESIWESQLRRRTRQAVLEAVGPRKRLNPVLVALAAIVALTVVASAGFGFLASRSALAASIRFEVRLAEEAPAPGLIEAAVTGSDREIYLHTDVIVGNGDISDAEVIEANGAFGVAVVFYDEGAARMLRATEAHVGRPLAILLDGEVVAVPTVRGPVGRSAVLDGDYSRAEAERIAAGIQGQ